MNSSVQARLLLAVALAGGGIMTLEISGSRLLAPYLGTSLYVWTSLIGVILMALAAGAYLGGRIADRGCSRRGLAWILFYGSLASASISPLSAPLLRHLDRNSLDLRLASTIAAAGLYLIPGILIGAVTPYTLALTALEDHRLGALAGRISAASTLGSIAGTLFTGFILFASIPTSTISYVVAATLLLASLLAESTSNLAPRGALAVTLVILILVRGYI